MKLSELQQTVRNADPAALIVASRVLDRVIRAEEKLPGMLAHVPHRQCFVVDRHLLFRHVEQEELELEPDRLLPSTVILLAKPPSDELESEEAPSLLLKYWRLLFHANLHLALEGRALDGKLSAEDVRERIEAIGPVEFAEIRRVLVEDSFLEKDADDLTVYIEFVAVFLELQYFAANMLASYFPAILNLERIKKLIAQDVDAEPLFERTRLAQAPNPVVIRDSTFDESDKYYWKLIGAANRTAEAGNLVGAAILRTGAARVSPAAYTAGTREQAEAELKQLMARLQAALQLTDADVAEWMRDLPSLLDKADQGPRPVEAALLYDLQRVCYDNERDSYALDLVEWLLSAGKRPIKRPLPSQRVIRISKHLNSAAQLLRRARLSDAARLHMGQLLQAALNHTEEELRGRFRPILVETFQDVGLGPTNPAERTAFLKLIEELLDRLTEFGFLTFSDVRDAISRNQLKLPDLSEPDDWVRGDPLLRLDRRLATLLDGVYRPAEFYLRWLERFTALSFGTMTGRAVTLFAMVPFGGAFLIVEALVILVDKLRGHGSEAAPGPAVSDASRYLLLFVFAFFLMGLIHVEPFRHGCAQLGVGMLRLAKGLLIDLPRQIWQIKALRWLVASWPFRLIANYLGKPAIVCGLLWLWLPDLFSSWLYGLLTYSLANFVLNSRPGQAATEALLQGLMNLYDLVRAGLLPGLVRLVIGVFKRLIDTVEYLLFTVDEWLRFRAGDSKISQIIRTVLGVLWFPISYAARFYMVVLIEPGINPIKFPISSLAAKFIYPFGVTIAAVMAELISPLTGALLASLFAGSTVWLLPDVFGFLVWEMKENWSLYRANRRLTMRPALVGRHGETVRRLLQAGFHSGTLPKLYARLRQAERAAAKTGDWQGVRVCGHDLQEVERALRRMVQREVVALVQQSPTWRNHRLGVGEVALASNRISLELTNPEYSTEPVWLDIEECEGWLVAGLRHPGWLEKVTAEQRQLVTIALAGFYKLAGVDLVREQLTANIPADFACYDITTDALILWLEQRGGTAICYEWIGRRNTLRPYTLDGEPAPEWPTLDARRLIFSRTPIAWQQWVDTWRQEPGHQTPPAPLFNSEVRLLPLEQSV